MPTNTEPTRQESDRDAIATIIQSGHIGHKTSDEIARDVMRYVNRALNASHGLINLTRITP